MKNFKLLTKTAIVGYILLATVLFIGCKKSEKSYEKCGYKTMKPGDTIIYRYPNIPKNIRVNNAKVSTYSHMDSIIITYNYELDSCR